VQLDRPTNGRVWRPTQLRRRQQGIRGNGAGGESLSAESRTTKRRSINPGGVAVSPPTSLARHARHDERDATPVRGRPARMGRAVGQDHVTLALPCLPIGLGAVVADQRLGVGLRQPASFLGGVGAIATSTTLMTAADRRHLAPGARASRHIRRPPDGR
jgi:hypothetical protein